MRIKNRPNRFRFIRETMHNRMIDWTIANDIIDRIDMTATKELHFELELLRTEIDEVARNGKQMSRYCQLNRIREYVNQRCSELENKPTRKKALQDVWLEMECNIVGYVFTGLKIYKFYGKQIIRTDIRKD